MTNTALAEHTALAGENISEESTQLRWEHTALRGHSSEHSDELESNVEIQRSLDNHERSNVRLRSNRIEPELTKGVTNCDKLRSPYGLTHT